MMQAEILYDFDAARTSGRSIFQVAFETALAFSHGKRYTE